MVFVNKSVGDFKENCNIYIVGFMGVGKTAVGRRLAYRLGMKFIDSDRAIEGVAGKTVSAIFAEEGEKRFREFEREFIERGHPSYGCVVACGGGLPMGEGVMERLKSQGMVIALFAREETILGRTQRRQTRPLLEGENKEERIANLLGARKQVYEKADYLIFSEGRSVDGVVGDILRNLRIYKPAQK